MAKKLSKLKPHEMSDQDWDAKHDAETLAYGVAIRKDPARLKRALAWAAALVEQENEQATNLKAVIDANS